MTTCLEHIMQSLCFENMMMYFHFNVLLMLSLSFGMGWFSTSHGSCWPLPDVVPYFLSFFLHMICGSCTGGMCQFSCGVNVVWNKVYKLKILTCDCIHCAEGRHTRASIFIVMKPCNVNVNVVFPTSGTEGDCFVRKICLQWYIMFQPSHLNMVVTMANSI